MSIRGPSSPYDRTLFVAGGVPVEFSPWVLMTAFFLLSSSRFGLMGLFLVVAYVASVLAHEGGHAFMASRYGLRPHIQVHAFGGYCSHARPRAAWQDRNIVLGGPAAGLLFAAACWAASWVASPVPVVASALEGAAWMSLFINVVNLVPALPLDGGRLAELAASARGISGSTVRKGSLAMALVAGTVGSLWTSVPAAYSLFLYVAWVNAYEVGWVPALSFGGPVGFAQRQRARPWWQPTPAVGVVVAIVFGLALVPGLVEPCVLGMDAVWMGEVWRLVAWPVAVRSVFHAILFAFVWWIVADAVEVRVRVRGVTAVAVAAWAASTVAAVLSELVGLDGGPLGGPWPIAWAAIGAWAALAPEANALPNFNVSRAVCALIAVWIGASNLLSAGGRSEAAVLWAATAAGIVVAVRLRARPAAKRGPDLRLVN
jgi:hypothetical protein